ncbi:type II toxin-antitoxin system HicB family antitoxin [Candidatus Kaiserbacteria bacterium]|nr:type II toxin-antitoxin system HicB family antitoxin [Candidatus Kaiserbacteria bacterium]
MKSYSFRAIIEPDEPKGFHGFVPILPGLHTHGSTLSEIKANLREAILCHVQGMQKDRERIPQEEEALEMVQTFSHEELIEA